MTRPTLSRLVLFLTSFLSTGLAQELGHGTLGPHGLEPRLSVRGAAAPSSARLTLEDLPLAQGGGPVVELLFSPLRGSLPLGGLGLSGAVFGLDATTTELVGSFQPQLGNLVLDVPVSAPIEGVPLHVQAYYLDPRVAGALPLVISDSTTFTLGSDAAPIVALREVTALGPYDVVRFLEDGRAATPLPDLQGIVPLQLALASISEERRLRPDLPSVTLRQRVRLPDGSRLLHYRHLGRNTLGLVHVRRDGSVRIVHEVPNTNPTHAAFDAVIAASPHGPYVAFLTLTPAPRIYLYRTDGLNLPGLAEPVADVSPLSLLDVEGGSLVFGRDVLAVMDRALGFSLVQLSTLQSLAVTLPPTSQGVPFVFDEEVGVSGDGRSFVFGAGPTRRSKDVYVVRDDGTARNVTNLLQDYGEVGYGDPGRLSELTLNEDGTVVAYVTNSTPEPEAFLRTLSQPSALHMTEDQTFSQSIDVGAIGRLPGLTAAAIVYAGSTLQQLDVFYTPTGQRNDIVNLTASGPNPQQRPFGLGGNLTLQDLGTTRSGGDVIVQAFDQALGQTVIHHLDLGTPSARVAQRGIAGPRIALGTLNRYAAASADQLALLDPQQPPASWRVDMTLPGVIDALHVSPSRDRLVVEARLNFTNDELWLVDLASGNPSLLYAPNAPIQDVLVDHGAGVAHVIVRNGATTELVRVPLAGGPVGSIGWTGIHSFLSGS